MQTCIACGSKENHKQGTQMGYVEGTQYDIFVCENCDTSWASPFLSDPAVYNMIYKNRENTPGYMRYSEYAKDVLNKRQPLKYLAHQEEMYYGLREALKSSNSLNPRILDVGCGLGYVTYALKTAGYDATGLDISSSAIDEAKKMYGDYFVCEDFFQHNITDNKKYDIICMLELIEHVDNPTLYIEHAMGLLKTDGILIITTPNKDFYPKGTMWGTEAPPVHLAWFSEAGISSLVSRLGFKMSLISFKFYNIFYGNLYKVFSKGTSEYKPMFSKQGELLYKKSPLRTQTEKLKIYSFIKRIQFLINKFKEFITFIFYSKYYTGDRSSVICAVIYNK